MSPKYSHIRVQLTGEDDSAPGIVMRCRQAAQRAGLPQSECNAFMRDAFSGDYDNVISTAMAWFTCD
ncbi:hypothetical protein FIU91_03755 [Roseivivax sp. THAF30]|nr:hypothetical protein FIU91_03755 [Roseivivax sp. THAF30]